ncbi:hypothetical protein AB0A63_11805 [Lentzea sp. NPDC042327]|uniref:hypothetical protein n=1 Tax=Lentzea sp. NPDC042327 TaxID=3154801 RepID=UPI0033DCDA38
MAHDPRVDELAALVGWQGTVDADEAVRDVERTLGIGLPPDFHALVNRFPTGYFSSFVTVPSPVRLANGNSPFLWEAQDALAVLREAADTAHPAYPAPGGLLPWASSTEGHVFFWRTGDEDPARWPTVFCDDELTGWGEYPGTASEFLRDVLTGRFTHEFFDPCLQGVEPDFEPEQREGNA